VVGRAGAEHARNLDLMRLSTRCPWLAELVALPLAVAENDAESIAVATPLQRDFEAQPRHELAVFFLRHHHMLAMCWPRG
jgi:hypothetical protein